MCNVYMSVTVLSSLSQDIVDCPNILHRQCKLMNVVCSFSLEYRISYAPFAFTKNA